MQTVLSIGVLIATLGADDPHRNEFVELKVKGRLNSAGDDHFVTAQQIKFRLILTPPQIKTASRLKGKLVLVQAHLQQAVKNGAPLLELKVRDIRRAIHDIELIANEDGTFKEARINDVLVLSTESKLANMVRYNTMWEIRIRFDKRLNKKTIDRIHLSVHKNAVYTGVKRISIGPRKP